MNFFLQTAVKLHSNSMHKRYHKNSGIVSLMQRQDKEVLKKQVRQNKKTALKYHLQETTSRKTKYKTKCASVAISYNKHNRLNVEKISLERLVGALIKCSLLQSGEGEPKCD